MSKAKKVLIVTSHYTPNIGGVETHLNDLVSALNEHKWRVIVATYQPLAKRTLAPFFEDSSKLTVYRFPWLGFNIVHKLTNYPIFEFLYLFPGLFLITGWSLYRNKDIMAIHAQGLVPAVVSLFWSKVFSKRIIVSTHNLYFFPKSGFYKQFSKFVFSNVDVVLTLSMASQHEVEALGVPKNKILPFRYWLNLKMFKPGSRRKARKEVGIDDREFVVFFIGRLIKTKGVNVILKTAEKLQKLKIKFVIAGSGPLGEEVKKKAAQDNIVYVGPLPQSKVPVYMSAADLVVAPSLVDEGYGRVAMEAIACGTPVLAAKKGGLSEVVEDGVGWLEKPNVQAFSKKIENLYRNKRSLKKAASNTRKYTLKTFSEKNVQSIIKEYEKKA